MASILRVNTLTDASSNNSTAMSTINQGTAKAWANLNGTGTIALRDSFNVASITDDGTGDYDFTYTNAMGNINYSIQMGNSFTSTSAWACNNSGGEVPTTAFWNMNIFDRNGSAQDATYAYFGINGDLA
tara:strand:- start:185 stop:571 length:387 start_codon:yes stop_codon:yes gene_type:complete